MMQFVVVLLFTVMIIVEASADNSAESSSTPGAPAESADSGIFATDNLAFRLYGGNFVAESDPQFINMRNQYALGFGFSAGIGNMPGLAMDVEYFFVNRDYDTQLPSPPFGTIDNDTSIETDALLVGGRLIYPPGNRLGVYLAAGFGLFRNKLETFGSTIGFPGELSQENMSIDIYYGAGIEFRYSSWIMSFDYRHLDLDGSFSDFQVTDADIGGDILVIGIGRVF